MRATLLVALVLSLFAAPAPQLSLPDYHGKLDAKLLPNNHFEMSIRFDPATEADKARLPAQVGPNDKVFYRRIKWPPETGKPLSMLLVEPEQGTPYLYADIDLDGKFSASERFAFPQFKANPGSEDDL